MSLFNIKTKLKRKLVFSSHWFELSAIRFYNFQVIYKYFAYLFPIVNIGTHTILFALNFNLTYHLMLPNSIAFNNLKCFSQQRTHEQAIKKAMWSWRTEYPIGSVLIAKIRLALIGLQIPRPPITISGLDETASRSRNVVIRPYHISIIECKSKALKWSTQDDDRYAIGDLHNPLTSYTGKVPIKTSRHQIDDPSRVHQFTLALYFKRGD